MDKPNFLTKNYHHRPRFWLVLFLVVTLLLLVRFCSSSKVPPPKTTDNPVIAAIAYKTDIPVYLDALGTVTPLYTVTVKTQLNGILQEVFYKEGQQVKAGDLLAQIDPRPYEALLLEYQGQLERDKALLANANIDLQRYKTLWSQKSVAQQTYQTQMSLVQQYEGTVKIDQGLIDSTLVNLIYCKIISPVDGRIGLRLVDPGNFVQTSDSNGIAVVTTLSPIDVVFPIAEDYIPQVLAQMEKNSALPVQAYDRQQKKLLAEGTLLTIDNQINTTTGTVNLKAQFTNSDSHLFANQFVNIRMLVDTLNDVIAVPTAAVQYRSNGAQIYVIDKNNKVIIKPVVVGITKGDETVIQKGLLAGEKVIVEGVENLVANDTVIITNEKALAVTNKPLNKKAKNNEDAAGHSAHKKQIAFLKDI